MSHTLVYVLATGTRIIADVIADGAEGPRVRVPLVIADGPEEADGSIPIRFVPLLAYASVPETTLRAAHVLCTYRPAPELAEAYRRVAAEIAGQLSPAPAEPPTPPGGRGLVFRESALAHELLDGLEGIEIGGSAHNPFGLHTRNVDYSDDMDTVFKQEEVKMCGRALPVDIVAPGDALPLPDDSVDFVVSSHVLEHIYDPIKALREWYRVVRPGGYLFMIVPHRDRTFDRDRPRTRLAELLRRHEEGGSVPPDLHGHCSVWITQDLVELIGHLGWEIAAVQDVDDKVGNGFTVAVRVGAKS